MKARMLKSLVMVGVVACMVFLFAHTSSCSSLVVGLSPASTVAEWMVAPEEAKEWLADIMSSLLGPHSVSTPQFVYDFLDQFGMEFPAASLEVTLGDLYVVLYYQFGPPVNDYDDDSLLEYGKRKKHAI